MLRLDACLWVGVWRAVLRLFFFVLHSGPADNGQSRQAWVRQPSGWGLKPSAALHAASHSLPLTQLTHSCCCMCCVCLLARAAAPAGKMTLSDDVNLEEFVMAKDELSGADIKAVCTEAGLLALRERRMRVTQVRAGNRVGDALGVSLDCRWLLSTRCQHKLLGCWSALVEVLCIWLSHG